MKGAIDIYFPNGKVVTQELDSVPDRRTFELLIGDPCFYGITDSMGEEYKDLPDGHFAGYCVRGSKVGTGSDMYDTTADDVDKLNVAWDKSEWHGDTDGYLGRIMVLYGTREFISQVKQVIGD